MVGWGSAGLAKKARLRFRRASSAEKSSSSSESEECLSFSSDLKKSAFSGRDGDVMAVVRLKWGVLSWSAACTWLCLLGCGLWGPPPSRLKRCRLMVDGG